MYPQGQGYPKFDQAKADTYFKAVVNKTALVEEIVAKWDAAKLFVK